MGIAHAIDASNERKLTQFCCETILVFSEQPKDRLRCSVSRALVVLGNINLLPHPPKCPECNPVENVWQFMRNNWRSNGVFKSYDKILDHRCFARNCFTDQP